MYEEFYKLSERPFSIQPDPDFLYFGRRHRLAYSMLEYGVENRAGFTVVTGEIGAGKTTLIRHLLQNLPDNYRVGLITNTHRNLSDLMEWIMFAFDQPYTKESDVAIFDEFQKFLIAEYAQGRRVILIVDEAQNLSVDALESLRMLSNINVDKHQLLQLILLGQPELKTMLRRPELQQFAQRVAVDFHITPLSSEEVSAYILHRLKVAGRDEPLFSTQACEVISRYSNGIPRMINILCDTALVYGMSMEAALIEKSTIEEVLRDKEEFGVFSDRASVKVETWFDPADKSIEPE